jgi:mycothiol S-conjugate amidase
MDRPEVRDRLAEIRMEELARSTEIIGYDEVVLLGYRDSGMPGTPENEDPRSFVQAPIEEAVGRLVAVIRRVRPQVMVTYGDDQRGYPHPDHLRVHDVGLAAFEAAGDPDAYPGDEPPWQPFKLYYTVWSRARVLATHQMFLDLGLESPFPKEWTDGPPQEQHITTSIDVSEHADVRPEALLAHATQVDPTSPFWFGLPPEVARTIHPFDEYVLARSAVRGTDGDRGSPEQDLFAGVRDRVTR